MEALKVNVKIASDTIKIPELSRFIGKHVEIILLEDVSCNMRKTGLFKLKNLNGTIDFDEDAINTLREKSML